MFFVCVRQHSAWYFKSGHHKNSWAFWGTRRTTKIETLWPPGYFFSNSNVQILVSEFCKNNLKCILGSSFAMQNCLRLSEHNARSCIFRTPGSPNKNQYNVRGLVTIFGGFWSPKTEVQHYWLNLTKKGLRTSFKCYLDYIWTYWHIYMILYRILVQTRCVFWPKSAKTIKNRQKFQTLPSHTL